MRKATLITTFLAAGLCLAVSLAIESEFYRRFLGSIMGQERYLWLPILAAATVQISRLATSWNSASFAARGMQSQATGNLRISAAIAVYETFEISIFGTVYLMESGAWAAFLLFGSFFVWVSFFLEIILVRSLTPSETPREMKLKQQVLQLRNDLKTIVGTSTNGQGKRKRNGQGKRSKEAERSLETKIRAKLIEEPELSNQALADLVNCSKTTAWRIRQQLNGSLTAS